jgi:Glutathione S-transferase
MALTLYTLCGIDPARPFSPHCWKAVMALAHKGLAFEEAPVPFTKIAEIEGGASRTVPLLRDGDRLVADSFAIAAHLEEAYPDRPSLFGGAGGLAAARFVEAWSIATLHAALSPIILVDIHDRLAPADQAYFRETRENRFGKTLEEVVANRDAGIAAFPDRLQPLRLMLGRQPFLGGEGPLFSDYIVFGALQWARVVSRAELLPEGDPVRDWFERCLDLHGGVARRVPAAAA